MGVNKPSSGDTITKQSVIGMHDTLRTNINAIDDQFIGPSSFSFEHMSSSASPLVGFDFVNDDGSSPIVMNTFGTNDTTGDVTATWQELTAYRLDNGGSGFTTVGASQYIVYFTCRIRNADNASGPIGADERLHAMFAISYEDNLGTETVIPTSIMGYGLYGIKDTTVFDRQEIPVAIWVSFNLPTGKIIDVIRFYSCLLSGSATPLVTNIDIDRGTSGCFVFERV